MSAAHINMQSVFFITRNYTIYSCLNEVCAAAVIPLALNGGSRGPAANRGPDSCPGLWIARAAHRDLGRPGRYLIELYFHALFTSGKR